MTSALAYKEFRETVWIAGLGLLALLAVVTSKMGWDTLPLQSRTFGEIPFLHDSFTANFGVAVFVLAATLGLRQSLGDFLGDAYLFLLHRPTTRRHVYGTKIFIGLALYFIVACVPVLFYAAWAALPGTHASPFDWTMTAPIWSLLLSISVIYSAAFLTGIRPGNWFGTRLAPLAAAAALIALLQAAPLAVAVVAALLVNALIIALILNVAEQRDFPG